MLAAVASEQITALLLCGGEGRRMGGIDKPLMPFRGKPMVQHVLDALRHAVADVVLVANRSLDTYRRFGYRVLTDDQPGLGPLSGIAAAAPHITTPWVFLCAGDMPLLDARALARLTAEVMPGDRAVPHTLHDGQRLQPLVSLLPSVVLATASRQLQSADRSVRTWITAQQTVVVEATDLAPSLISIDDPEQLRRWE